MVIKEIFTPEIAITWLPWAVQYMFMMGLAFASVWLAAIHLFNREKTDARLLKLCGFLMLTAGIVAPIGLMGDLHQPLRAWHFYAQVRPESWMWYGAFFMPVFSGTSALFAWLLLRQYLPTKTPTGHDHSQCDWISRIGQLIRLGNWNSDKWLKPVAFITAISASSMALYMGMETMAMKALPLWHTYWLTPLLASSALLAASGTLVILNRLLTGYQQCTQNHLILWLRASFSLFTVSLIGWALFDHSSAPEAARLVEISASWQHSAIWLLITLGVLAFILMIRRLPKVALYIVSLTAIHLAWGFRWILLIQAQTAPKYGAGTYLYQLPWGPDGLLGIVGTFGLWLALMALVSELIRQKPTAELAR
ncbi:MAG: NrfD/PsrC family molybdoenzyme membrane anchor subunit [Shewanella sp.]